MPHSPQLVAGSLVVVMSGVVIIEVLQLIEVDDLTTRGCGGSWLLSVTLLAVGLGLLLLWVPPVATSVGRGLGHSYG